MQVVGFGQINPTNIKEWQLPNLSHSESLLHTYPATWCLSKNDNQFLSIEAMKMLFLFHKPLMNKKYMPVAIISR